MLNPHEKSSQPVQTVFNIICYYKSTLSIFPQGQTRRKEHPFSGKMLTDHEVQTS